MTTPFTSSRRFGLSPLPKHNVSSIVTVPSGEAGIDLGGRQTVNGEIWANIQVPVVGWTLASYLDEIADPANGPHGISGNWTLAFSDEFNNGNLDLTKWSPNWLAGSDIANSPPVNSSELAAYSPSQVSIVNSSLHLTASAIPLNINGKTYPYSSGMTQTDGKFSFTYGALEARIWTPAGKGIWPAFWTDGQNWPVDGEVDILEAYGNDASSSGHYHYIGGSLGFNSTVVGSTTDWHTYAINWEPDIISWYYDGFLVHQITSSQLGAGNIITSSPQFIVLNLAVNGTLSSQPIMQVDYVRLWQSS